MALHSRVISSATERLAALHPGRQIAVVGHGGVMDYCCTAPQHVLKSRHPHPGR
jgi:broad specificity phosphatase PhoE